MARKTRKKRELKIKYAKRIIIGIFLIFVLFVLFNRGVSSLQQADLFEIKHVIKAPSLQFVSSQSLDHLKGKNIFKADLRTIQRHLQAKYPEIESLRVSRKFPDEIHVSAKKREPFAVIAQKNKDVLLDRRGVVLSYDISAYKDLPLVMGVPIVQRPVLGKSLRSTSLRIALHIVERFNNSDRLEEYKVQTIDVGNLSKIIFYVSDDLKIIVDRESVDQAVQQLGLMLNQPGDYLKDVNYIDLRFKEPVLGRK